MTAGCPVDDMEWRSPEFESTGGLTECRSRESRTGTRTARRNFEDVGHVLRKAISETPGARLGILCPSRCSQDSWFELLTGAATSPECHMSESARVLNRSCPHYPALTSPCSSVGFRAIIAGDVAKWLRRRLHASTDPRGVQGILRGNQRRGDNAAPTLFPGFTTRAQTAGCRG